MLKNHRVRAFLWFVFILCALSGAHYCFYRFSFHPLNPFQITRGLTFASTLWSSVLLLAMVLHYAWARYVLIAWLVLVMFGFGMATLMMNSQSVATLPEPTKAALLGLLLYAVALTPLGFSRSLRRYLAPRTAGGK